MFYVDDILHCYRPEDKTKEEAFKKQLTDAYEMRDEGEIQWFLGIRVLRDRPAKKLWLCQSSYIEKITHKYGLATLSRPAIPIPVTPLHRNTGQASKGFTKIYQEKVGSILYVATMTRPDVARAAAELSKYLTNPSKAHMDAADQAIQYLYATHYWAIEYNGNKTDEYMVIASDASFADDPEDRKSSQGYIIQMCGGPVVWKASKQATVTTSTTEAELLALDLTVRESYAVERFLRDIARDLDIPLRVFCDNQQTIRLVVGQNERITTKLRHIDIHNLWLRQEYGKGRFCVDYLPTAQMPADGLTKALPRQKFEHFQGMLGMVDIRERLQGKEIEGEMPDTYGMSGLG